MPALMEQLSAREREILTLIADGASDREIAAKLYLSINTVKWHNRQIYAKLGVGSRGRAATKVDELGLSGKEPDHLSLDSLQKDHNLPTILSSFIGRDDDIARIIELLGTNRLLTLIGPGGVGKTRLAIRVATILKDNNSYQDGIYFVDLAPVTKTERVKDAVFESLGLVPASGLSSSLALNKFLEGKVLLLVIDNFEHVLDSTPLIQDLLSTASNLTILATSREPLNLSGEQIYQISPLPLPDLNDESPIESFKQNESVSLFLQRAQTMKPNLDLSDQFFSEVAEICIRLDGLPLAIELAAARMKFFSPKVVLKQLEDRFNILKDGPRDLPERHQTLKKAIDWSYNLLPREEQTFLNRLAVFEGGFSIEAVEQICCMDISLDVLDGLVSMITKNLIYQDEGLDGEARFFMLETIQEYGMEKLVSNGEFHEIIQKHSKYYTELAEKAEDHTRGGAGTVYWLKMLESEHDNLRVAFDRSLQEGIEFYGLRLVGALDYFWLRSCFFDEGEMWTNQVLDLVEQAPIQVKADVFSSLGMVNYYRGELEKSITMYKRALDLYQQIGDKRELGWINTLLMYPYQGNLDEDELMREYFKNAMCYFGEVDDKAGMGQALALIGVHDEIMENYLAAEEAINESNKLAKEIGDEMRLCYNFTNQAYILMSKGDPKSAESVFKEGLSAERKLGLRKVWSADTFKALALCSMNLGKYERALVLLSAGSVLFDRRGIGPFPPVIEEIQNMKEEAIQALGGVNVDQLWTLGKTMNFEEAMAYALEED